MKGNKLFLKYSILLVFPVLFFATGCTTASKNTNKGNGPGNKVVTAVPIHFLGGWGYTIKINNQLYIYQNQIPCLPGKQLFPTRESAMKVAGLVKRQIAGGMSPSVTKEEVEKALQ